MQFFVDVNGSNPLEVASEVDRYCSWPGQACGYKVGHSEINRLRQKATAALGPKYDLKAFNDTVVLGGNVPLDVLAKNVDEYIRAASTQAAAVTHVVLLRGVNVGGHRTFRPARLAEQLRHLGAVNIGAAGTFVIRKAGQSGATARGTGRAGFRSTPTS